MSAPGWRRKARESLGLARLLLLDRGSVAEVYELLGAHNNLARDSLYLNLGLWREASTYDEACEALALYVGEVAALGTGQRVCDAGFGFADQDMAWVRHFGVDVEGFNVTESQVVRARERVAAAGLSGRIALHHASALATGLEDASCDAVIALESAFHFPSRDAFFAEAHRVLKPGGRLVLADLVLVDEARDRVSDRLALHLARAFWRMPASALIRADDYQQKLRDAGFVDLGYEDIGEHVFAGFNAYASERVRDPEVVARVHPLLRRLWAVPAGRRLFDYAVIAAVKPG